MASDDYYGILAAAKQAGLEIAAVDKPRKSFPRSAPGQLPFPEQAREGIGRDGYMASKIAEILQNPQAKVIFWAGSLHLDDPPGEGGSAVERLRTNHKVGTVLPELSQGADLLVDTLPKLTPDLRQPVAIPMSKADKIADLPTGPLVLSKYGWWDEVMIFPRLFPR